MPESLDSSCIFCETNYSSDRHGEKLFQCRSCNFWAHTACHEERHSFEAGPSRRSEAGPSRRSEAGPSQRYEAGPSSRQEAGPSQTKYEENADSNALDAMAKESVNMEAGPSHKSEASSSIYEEEEDYSCSGSSWVPSDDEDLSDDSDTEAAPVTTERRNSKKTYMKSLNLIRIRKVRKHLAIAIQMQNEVESEDESDMQDYLEQMTVVYDCVVKLLHDFQQRLKLKQKMLKAAGEMNITEESVEIEEYYEENMEIEDQNPSNAVLVNNRCNVAETNKRGEREWIPIGSGKTLIHRDKFKKVNWKSYTIATRTLLLAVFSRRILATHSLTGKGSPAFKDKPVKMGLDPKKISDIIIEITERFDVREGEVRSIITTKCADECKMLRMRRNQNKPKNDENMPPDTNNNSDKENENQEEEN